MDVDARFHMKGGTLFSIQYLRALAAMLVVYHHAREQFPGFQQALPNSIGTAGVDLFFVISGFIMVTITDMQPIGPGEFVIRRIVRIVPVYWFYTTITAVAILIVPMFFRDSRFTVSHYVLSLLFVPHLNPGDMSVSPLLKLGWTLNYEMFFYCLFSATLLLVNRSRILILTLAFIGLVLVGWIFEPQRPPLVVYTDAIILEFALGTLIGYAFVTGRLRRIGSLTSWTLIVVALVAAPLLSVFDGRVHRVIIYGIPACLIVLGSIALEVNCSLPKHRLFRLVGDSSYSIYLAHLYPVVFLRFFWPRLGLGIQGLSWTAGYVFVAMVSAIVIGILSYSLLERPLNRRGHRLLTRWLSDRYAPAL
jgi:exopolysaccharide production protein ExoZ